MVTGYKTTRHHIAEDYSLNACTQGRETVSKVELFRNILATRMSVGNSGDMELYGSKRL